MVNNNTEKYLPEVLQQVRQEKVVLFLGAGASHATGGPTGGKLTEMIKGKFPNLKEIGDLPNSEKVKTPIYDINTPE